MTKDEAVSAIAKVLEAVEDGDMATVIYRAIDRANVRKNIARKRGGSSLRQGVIFELYEIEFPPLVSRQHRALDLVLLCRRAVSFRPEDPGPGEVLAGCARRSGRARPWRARPRSVEG